MSLRKYKQRINYNNHANRIETLILDFEYIWKIVTRIKLREEKKYHISKIKLAFIEQKLKRKKYPNYVTPLFFANYYHSLLRSKNNSIFNSKFKISGNEKFPDNIVSCPWNPYILVEHSVNRNR